MTATENRLEYRLGDLTERYVNGSRGLDRGFTFAHRPSGGCANTPLVIALGVTGDLALQQKNGAVLLASGKGVVLRYAGLTAWDSGGRLLPSRLEARPPDSPCRGGSGGAVSAGSRPGLDAADGIDGSTDNDGNGGFCFYGDNTLTATVQVQYTTGITLMNFPYAVISSLTGGKRCCRSRPM